MGSVWSLRFAGAAVLAQGLLMAACQSAAVEDTTQPLAPERLEYVTQFKRIDTAGKGSISFEQTTAHYTALFDQFDKNRNGYLDAVELEAIVPVMGATSGTVLLLKLDRNSDQKVSRQEFLTIANWLFQLSRSPSSMSLEEAQRGMPPSSNPKKPATLFGD